MKKFLFGIVMLFFLNIPVSADDVYINTDLPIDENLERQMPEVFKILDEAKVGNDLNKYYSACAKGYKVKKVGNTKNIKLYNDALSAFAIEYSLQNYKLTQNKKYLKNAFKWSKIAVKDKTSQIYSIRADILLASLFFNLKEMQKAYKIYRAVDLQGANDFQNEYLEAYNSTKAYIFQRNAKRKAKWVNALKTMGRSLAAGLSAFGNSYNNYNYGYNYGYNNYPTNTHCYSIGNNVYCNSY